LGGINNHLMPAVLRSLYRAGPQRVNNIRMFIPEPPAWGGGGEFHMAIGSYEYRELAFILDQIDPGDCFVDIGAHIGYFTLPVARRIGPLGTVVAIEPTPDSAACLRANVALNDFGWVTVVEAAASDVAGQVKLTTSDVSAMWNTLEADTLTGGVGVQLVPARRVDEVLADAGWPRVAWIKMDVEGHEAKVLQGCTETLDRYPNIRIMFEVSGGNPERDEASSRTLKWLSERGFEFTAVRGRYSRKTIDMSTIHEQMRAPRWQDSLFNLVAQRPDTRPAV
jgi:FkbM family methyltransferase